MNIKEVYSSALTLDDFMSADVQCLADTYVKIGERKIEAGELVALGYGLQSGLNNAQGRIFIDLKNATPEDLNGIIRIVVHSPQDRPLEILGEWHTKKIRSGANDMSLRVPLPFRSPFVQEDKKIVIEFKSDTTDTVKLSNSELLMDVTNGVV